MGGDWFLNRWVGGWVGGWLSCSVIDRKIEENEAVGMS